MIAIQDVSKAIGVNSAVALRTPFLPCRSLHLPPGPQLFVKLEQLQRTGSFKFRAANFRVHCLDQRARRTGIVSYSSGNFGIALAEAAGLHDVPVTIIVPPDIPASKRGSILARGAIVKDADADVERRESLADECARVHAQKNGSYLLHPFEDPLLIAGHVSFVLELFDQAKTLDVVIDHLFVPGGGGGLLAACVVARQMASPNTEIHCVEPAGFNGIQRSLRKGERVRASDRAGTICDALRAECPGEIAFELFNGQVSSCVVVDDGAVRQAMRVLFDDFHVLAEPSSALAFAGVQASWNSMPPRSNVGLLLCGANVTQVEFGRHMTTVI